MNKRHTIVVILFSLTFPLANFVSAQQPETSPVPQTTASPVATPNEQRATQAENMDKMATTVTRAAEMCETMMKKEMAAAPYTMAAGIGLGILLLIALILFVVLEIQWIIYWSGLLKRKS